MLRKLAYRSTAGFTLVELMVVIVIIGILASLSYSIVTAYQNSGTDAERTSDVEAIARSFEISYLRDATVNGPTYPTTVRAVTTSGYPALFKGQDLEATRAPSIKTGTSIVAAANTNQPQNPTKDQYIYLPLTAGGGLCDSTAPCVKFLIYYRLENNDSLQVVESIRQQ